MNRVLGLLILFCSAHAYAQQDAIWIFGSRCGIDFRNPDFPVVFDSQIPNNYDQHECNASISDNSGNLLAFSHSFNDPGEVVICNSYFGILDNGTDVLINSSVTNGLIFLPKPKNEKIVYLFHLNTALIDDGLYYTSISFENDSNGIILEKNKLIKAFDPTEKLAAVKHANGLDWWIITHPLGSDSFNIHLLTEDTILEYPMQQIGAFHPEDNGPYIGYCYGGEMKFNKQGDQLALVNWCGTIDLFDFDRCNGKLSNHVSIGLEEPTIEVEGAHYYGMEFSPSGRYLFVSCAEPVLPSYLFCYDLMSGNIKSSQLTIDTLSIYAGGQLELAPNGLIYMGHSGISFNPDDGTDKLGVISNPDNDNCDFQQLGLDLVFGKTVYGLPNMPNYNLGALPPRQTTAGEDCEIFKGSGIEIGEVAQDSIIYQWQPAFGLSNPNIANPLASPSSTISYTLTTTDLKSQYSCNPVSTDTVLVTVIPVLLPVTSISIYPNPSEGIFNIQWNGELCDNCELKIYNTLGELVSVHSMTAPLSQIDLGFLSDGIYYYRVLSTEEVIYTGKLLVCKK